jgi:hypothetical protein
VNYSFCLGDVVKAKHCVKCNKCEVGVLHCIVCDKCVKLLGNACGVCGFHLVGESRKASSRTLEKKGLQPLLQKNMRHYGPYGDEDDDEEIELEKCPHVDDTMSDVDTVEFQNMDEILSDEFRVAFKDYIKEDHEEKMGNIASEDEGEWDENIDEDDDEGGPENAHALLFNMFKAFMGNSKFQY